MAKIFLAYRTKSLYIFRHNLSVLDDWCMYPEFISSTLIFHTGSNFRTDLTVFGACHTEDLIA